MRNNSELDRRRRRRRRRLQVLLIYTAIAIGLAWFFESQATTTIIFVRHAERSLVPPEDPGLSDAGRRRAAELARQLVDADVVAGVDAIYATQFRRSQETAHAVAARHQEVRDKSVPINTYDAADEEIFLEAILSDYKGKIVLVIGHSNTLPNLIANLGASKKVPAIAEAEYDNIYVISIPWFGKTKTIRLRFGEPFVASVPG